MKKSAEKLNKYIMYGLFIFVLFVLQTVPGLIPNIGGALPVPLIPMAVIIAMYEGETAGAAFGLAAGLLIDVNSVHLAGFAALILMIIGCVCGLLCVYLMRNTMMSCMLLSLAAAFTYFFLYWICFWVVPLKEQMFSYFLKYSLVSVLYTTVLAFPLYIIIRRIFRQKRKKMRYS